MSTLERFMLLGLSLISACSFSTPILEIPADGAAGLLIALIDRDGGLSLTALEVGASSEPFVSVPLAEDTEVYALHYACNFAALALSLGPQVTVTPPAEGRPLPDPARIFRAEVNDGAATPLAELEELPDILRAVRLKADRSACVSFETATFDVPDTSSELLSVGLTLEDRRVFIATSDARVFTATFDGLVEHTRLSTTARITGGFRAGDGEMLLASTEGRTFRGRLETGFRAGPSTVSKLGFLRSVLSGPLDGSLSEVFLVDGVKSFERLFDDRWTRINPDSPPINYDRGGVVWLSPARAVAVGLNAGPLARFDNGAFTAEPLPIESTEIIRAIRFVDRWDLVFVTSDGRVVLNTRDGWRVIYKQEGGMRVIAPIDRGLIVGGGDGFFVQLHPGFEPCIDQLSARNIDLITELPDGFALISGTDVGRDGNVTILRRGPAPLPAECPR